MNILITGGTGFIGSSFIRKYQDKHHFTVLTRNPDKLAEIFGHRRNITALEKLYPRTDLNDFDAIINLAGEPIVNKRWTLKQKRKICQSRWKLTNKLSKLINDSTNPPRVFISGSAVGFYGRQGEEPITESFKQIYQEFSHRVCKVWEDNARLAKDKTRLCILRTGIVLDAKQGALKKMLPIYRCGLGGKLSHGQQYMPWIHIEDMIDGIDFLLDNTLCEGEFNFTAPNPVTNKEFSRTLANTLNRFDIAPVPAFALRLLMGECADIILYGQNAIPERLQQHKFTFTYPSLDKALANLLN